ncbi:MAG: YebC/PmpR family DNA-binding transcriptional regulator [Candidatus Saccharimonadales bacterium]
MSGHSKWATIKRQKGANDAKRGALFTKLGKQLAVAARGGSNPATNPALAMAIDQAKAANMPLANIERSIQRVKDKSQAQLEEVMYEGYGPGGIAVLVEVATDNKNRTYPQVRLAFTKNGGQLSSPGSVAFQFTHKGIIRVKDTGEDILMAALDAGAEDAFEEPETGETVIYTAPKNLAKVRDSLISAKLGIVEAGLGYEPKDIVKVEDEQTAHKVIKLMDALDELEDVTNTYTNFDIAEGVKV